MGVNFLRVLVPDVQAMASLGRGLGRHFVKPLAEAGQHVSIAAFGDGNVGKSTLLRNADQAFGHKFWFDLSGYMQTAGDHNVVRTWMDFGAATIAQAGQCGRGEYCATFLWGPDEIQAKSSVEYVQHPPLHHTRPNSLVVVMSLITPWSEGVSYVERATIRHHTDIVPEYQRGCLKAFSENGDALCKAGDVGLTQDVLTGIGGRVFSCLAREARFLQHYDRRRVGVAFGNKRTMRVVSLFPGSGNPVVAGPFQGLVHSVRQSFYTFRGRSLVAPSRA